VDPNVQAQRKLAEKMRAEEHVLVDPEDEGIQQILQSKLEPTLQMHEFFAVQSKLETLNPGREEVPGACETLWRDINRMIDILGLNSRSLQSFLLGHSTQFKEGGRSKDDLENPDDWVLVEAEELGAVLDDEVARCAKGRIQDLEGAEDAIKSFAKDLAKLRAKEEDMRKIITAHIDPDQLAVAKSLPLSAEQATQQNELRRSYATFSQLLAETEEALTLLRARIASAGGASGKTPVPTVEAIIRTINKMTSMAEKRSGDIDVLESQMRRLRLGSMGPSTPGPRSREGSPFVTPQQQQRRSLLMSSSLSPEKDGGSGSGGSGSRLLRESMSMASSVTSYGGGRGGTPSPRKKMSMYSEEEKRELRGREAKRKGALQMLRKSLARAGPNVSRLRDD
jgi:nucleoporin NUP159